MTQDCQYAPAVDNFCLDDALDGEDYCAAHLPYFPDLSDLTHNR